MIHWFRRRLWPALMSAVTEWSNRDNATMSAALAYYAGLSLFPICLSLAAGLGWLSHVSSEFRDQQRQLLAMVESSAGPWMAGQLQSMLAGVKTQAAVAGPIGMI